MNHYDILLIILIIAFCYNTYELNNLKKQKIEGFDAASDLAINTAVKKIYLADVEAIRLLSNFAIQLSQGGITVPGNVTFAGNVNVNGVDGGKRISFGAGEIKMNGNGIAHYSIINKDGQLKISNTSGNGELNNGLVNDCITFNRDGTTIMSNKLSLNKKPLLLYADNDTNHILTYDSAKNGVMLCGYLGGYLGSANNGTITKSLEWGSDGNITVYGTINCKAINITG